MRRILAVITKNEWKLYFFALIFILLQVVFEILIPQKMGDIAMMLQDGNGTVKDVLLQGLVMLAYSLLALLAAVFTAYFISKSGAAIDRCIRKNVFEKTMSFSLEEMGEFGTSSLISRCTTDINQVQMFITGGVQNIFLSALKIISIIGCMASAHWYWSASTFVAVAIIVLMLTTITIVTMPAVKRVHYVNDELIERSREHIMGIHVIHAYNGFGFQKKRYEAANEEQTKLYLFYEKAMAVFTPGAAAVLYLLSVVIYVIGAYILLTVGDSEKAVVFSNMVEFISYANMLVISFIYIILVISMLPPTLVSASRIAQVLDTDVSIKDSDIDEPVSDANRGAIEFSHVSFKYPGSNENVLTDISFKINKGETFAIIGATGCGKTTLLNLIPRLYDASEGDVFVDGINVKDYKIKNLRNILGYVPQKSRLFSGTIAQNIAYGENGKFQAALSDIENAARIGQADEFIKLKENQYNATVAHGGSNFSGGQRQRLTISRAICRDPEIYIFDDSFSALDYKTDATLRKKLHENAGDATMCIVAQRISTIRNADRILVMDKGRIVGNGKHDDLIKECDVYREIVEAQNKKEER